MKPWGGNKNTVIVQTSDGHRYKPMIDATQELHKRYASRHGYDYFRFDGVKRGLKPWHAAFNRVYIIEELIKEGKYDWVLYMDADAVIIDLSKSLSEFLDDRYSIVACRGSSDDPTVTWNVNNGIIFFNLRHPSTLPIIMLWKAMYENHSLEQLAAEAEGVFNDSSKHINDQDMLCMILYHKFRNAAKVYRGEEHNKFNYLGPFIQQILRRPGWNTEDRIEDIKEKVKTVEEQFPKASQQSRNALL